MTSELQKKLAEMKDKYVISLPEKISELRQTWLLASSIDDKSSTDNLYRKIHSLAGTSATFEQVKVSEIAKSMETFVKNHIKTNDLFAEKNVIEVNCFIDILEKSISYETDSTVNIVPSGQDFVELFVPKMKILLVDDDEENRDRLELILKSSGHDVLIAVDGEQAVTVATTHFPDIILMDVVMPNMTGYDAAKKIKSELRDKFVPIIFLTAITENELLAGCIAAGGDDFLNKPVHPLIINAKLASFYRIIQMYKKLDEYQIKNEEEMQASKEVLDFVIYSNDQNIEGLQLWAKSPGHFSGDTRLYRKQDSGRILILLCDFTGHGLPAAIGTVFVSDLFRSMTSKNIPTIAILSEINSKMNQILPVGRYCAAVMMDYDPDEKKIDLWNCGLPGVYLINSDHKITNEYNSQNVPLGVLPGKVTTEPYKIDMSNSSEILIFSDGITEAENSDGEMYGDEKLVNLIENTEPNSDLFSAIKEDVENFMDGEEPSDDISLISFKF